MILVMPVPRILILLSYQQSAFRVSFSCGYARLDSNQRPTESELSDPQATNRCGTRLW